MVLAGFRAVVTPNHQRFTPTELLHFVAAWTAGLTAAAVLQQIGSRFAHH
jgi:hypothetical protein